MQGCVYARKPADRAKLKGLGYDVIAEADLASALSGFSLVFNTAPSLLLSREMTARCPDCLLIDLASAPGGIAKDCGRRLIHALGLPAKVAPKTAACILRDILLKEMEESPWNSPPSALP